MRPGSATGAEAELTNPFTFRVHDIEARRLADLSESTAWRATGTAAVLADEYTVSPSFGGYVRSRWLKLAAARENYPLALSGGFTDTFTAVSDDAVERKIDYWSLPKDAISCASSAAAELREMGPLHVGSHVLLELLNQGYVALTERARGGQTALQAAQRVDPSFEVSTADRHPTPRLDPQLLETLVEEVADRYDELGASDQAIVRVVWARLIELGASKDRAARFERTGVPYSELNKAGRVVTRLPLDEASPDVADEG